MVTVPLIGEAARAGVLDEARRHQSFQIVIGFYDWIIKSLPAEGQRGEVVAKASRRVGGLRLAVGDRRGLDDYALAIRHYEDLAARAPRQIWNRGDLIATLLEYAGHLGDLGDPRAASARRRAGEIAEGLLADDDARLECYRTALIPRFRALVKMTADATDATTAERTLADRIARWIKENPEPTGKTVFLPRP
jgi:hypothetical protein